MNIPLLLALVSVLSFALVSAQEAAIQWLPPAKKLHLRIVKPEDIGSNPIAIDEELELVISGDKGIDVTAGYGSGRDIRTDEATLVEREGTSFTVRFAPPRIGPCSLVVFAKRPSQGNERYPAAVIIPVDVRSVYEPARTFPESFWALRKHGIRIEEGLRGVIETEGETKLRFLCPPSVILYPTLSDNNGKEAIDAVFVEPIEDGYLVKLSPPRRGSYTLSINAKERSTKGRQYDVVLRYSIILAEEPENPVVYPPFLSSQDEYLPDYDIRSIGRKPEDRDWRSIDSIAQNAPGRLAGSADSLARYLTGGAKDDFEKARAIYVWITANISYALKEYLSGTLDERVTEWPSVLRSKRGVCQGYADLFCALSSRAGLHSTMISGKAKGFGLRAGSHAWNAVELEGRWYLLDPTWGAGHVANGKFERKFNEKYFLTPPETMITDHYPRLAKYQFLGKPVSEEEWAVMPRDERQ